MECWDNPYKDREKSLPISFKHNFNLLKNGKSMDIYVQLAGLLTFVISSMP